NEYFYDPLVHNPGLLELNLHMMFLFSLHCFRFPLSSVIIAHEMKRSVDHQTRHFLTQAYAIFLCLCACPVEVHVNLALKHWTLLHRKTDYVCCIIMLEMQPVDSSAILRVHVHHRNPSALHPG